MADDHTVAAQAVAERPADSARPDRGYWGIKTFPRRERDIATAIAQARKLDVGDVLALGVRLLADGMPAVRLEDTLLRAQVVTALLAAEAAARERCVTAAPRTRERAEARALHKHLRDLLRRTVADDVGKLVAIDGQLAAPRE